MIDLNFICFAINSKRKQMETANVNQLSHLLRDYNGLLKIFNSEIERLERCTSSNQKRATDAKPLLPRAVEDVLLALEIPLDKCREQSLNSRTDNPQSLASELLRKSGLSR